MLIKFDSDQLERFAQSSEDEFVARVRRHLVKCCPASHLPKGEDAQLEDTRDLIETARFHGLSWQSTIAEFARLTVRRRAGERVVNPVALLGQNPDTADARMSDNMNRARMLNSQSKDSEDV